MSSSSWYGTLCRTLELEASVSHEAKCMLAVVLLRTLRVLLLGRLLCGLGGAMPASTTPLLVAQYR